MKSKKPLLLCLLLLAGLSVYPRQKQDKPKVFKFGKIELNEFETKPAGADSAASAIVLFDVGKGWFEYSAKRGGFVYVFDCHTRYKIINKTGYDYGNLELSFYKHNNAETVLNQMEGATYNLEGGKIVTSKINKDAKFTEKQDKNFTLKKFALPNIKEGSIVEFKYKIVSDFIFTLRPWYFQSPIPALYSEYEITIPEYYKYRVNAGGYIFLNPKQEYVNQNFHIGSDAINLNCLRMHYHADSIPGLKTENFITTMKDYVSKVGFELNSIKIPGQVYEDFTSTWPKLVKVLKEEETFGLFINKKSHSRTILKEIMKPGLSQDTTLQLLFNYVKNNIKWNNEYSNSTSENNPKTIFEKKTGNSADIGLCLLTLLTEAGIKASPVLISTRENGMHPGLPMITQFDNVIVAAEIGDKQLLLDATDKNHSPDLIGYDNLNHQGLKVNLTDETASWISLDNEALSRSNIYYMLKLDTDNKLTGKIYLSSTNYAALKRRDKYISATNETDFLKDYKSDKPGLGISKYEIVNLNNLTEPLTETMDVVIEDNIEEAGNLAYFMPLFFERTKENPFKLEERKFPVDFGYPIEEMFRLTIDLPEGYQLDKAPKNEKVILPNEDASFTFMFKAEENRIMMTSRIVIKKALFTPEDYHYLKELFKNVVRKQAEQIVIKKG